MKDVHRLQIMLKQAGYFPTGMVERGRGVYLMRFDGSPPSKQQLENSLSAVGIKCLGFASSKDMGWCATIREAELASLYTIRHEDFVALIQD